MIAKLLGRLRRAPEPAPARASAPPEHDAAALLAQGNAALGRGELQEAKRCYRAACDAQPAEPTPRLNLGYVLLELGEAQGAVDALQQAIALRRPQDAFLHEALYLRGRAEQALGRAEDAIASFRAALGSRPGFEEPLLEIVPLLIAQSHADEALTLADAASASTPSATSLMMRARALHALRRYTEALAAVDAVLAREPGHAGALETRGNLLLEVDRAEEAVAVFESLLAARGPDPALLANLAAALRELERPHDVVRLTAEAAKQHPQHAELQLNRAIAQLTVGDLPAGWQGFEWRWHAWSGKAAPWERWPRWRGEHLPQGSVLLVGEQGLGDSIQFLRYVSLVAARVREVILVLQAPLVALAQGLAPNCRVVSIDAAVPNADRQCPLMSLPHVFGTTFATLPAKVPYLHAEPERVETWRARLPSNGRPKAGIVWSGNPSHGNDRNRSIPLQIFQGIDPGNAQFVSLQPQVRESDRGALAAWSGLFDAGPQLRDFGDTAALLGALDLVVTVDTSVAHLAGALGRPVWILLPFAPDWRWMLERPDTPWYPTMRLYRQRKLGDWSEVVAQVQRDLQSFEPPRQ